MMKLDIASTSLLYMSFIDYSNSRESYTSFSIKISCPNLKVLKYNALIVKDIILENLLSVEVIHIFFYDSHGLIGEIGMLVHKMIQNVPSISVLKLCLASLRGLYIVGHEVRNYPFTFYKLKCLRLAVGIDEACMQVMILLLKHSPNLEVLNLWSDENDGWEENWKLHDPSESIVCLESHLKFIQLTGFKYEENEMELLKFFLKNAQVSEKVRMFWGGSDVISEEAVEVVLKYPKTSPHVVTFLDAKPIQKFGY